MRMYAYGRSGGYDATGEFKDNVFTVLKGSRISPKEGKKLYPAIRRMRADKDIVSSDMMVLKNVSFNSISSAANFVTGNITNGNKVWKKDKIKNKEAEK